MLERCPWSDKTEIERLYHDEEWGTPLHDEQKHFEFLTLECAQAGLSWLTILKKRENYRAAFAGFDPGKVSAFDDADRERLLADAGIIRNRLKIDAAINNAKRFLEVQKEFGSFDAYIWGFTEGKPVVNAWENQSDLPATSPLSDLVAKDLKKRGFKFVGSTTIYAHLQAIGVVNDHLVGCPRYAAVQKLA